MIRRLVSDIFAEVRDDAQLGVDLCSVVSAIRVPSLAEEPLDLDL